MKKIIAGILTVCMLALPVFATDHSEINDMPDDWSTEAIEAAIENGLLFGSNGQINPKGNLTRAEMCAIITRAVNAQRKESVPFSDVKETDWFHDEVAKAYAMQVVYGDGDEMRPNDPISREEAMTILGRLFALDEGEASELNGFYDMSAVSEWAKGSVAAMVQAGFVVGADGKLEPKENITRAEFAALMDRMVGSYVSKPGTVSEDIEGNVMLNRPDISLENITIHGDLMLGEGVSESLGNGTINLNGVKVEGRIIVRGGGNNVLASQGSSVDAIAVSKTQGDFKFVSDSTSSVEKVKIMNKGYSAELTGSINIIDIAGEASVKILNADVQTMNVTKPNAILSVEGTAKVENVIVAAANMSMTVATDATVQRVAITGEKANISGKGAVDTVVVEANDAKIDTRNTSVSVKKGVVGTTSGGEALPDDKTTTTPKLPVVTPSPSPIPSPSGGSKSSELIQAFWVSGTKAGTSDITILATATFENEAWIVDFSGASLMDTIQSGQLTTTFGSDLTFGSYALPTKKLVSISELYAIFGISSKTSSITVGALKNLIEDKDALEALFTAKTGKPWPEEYISISGNTVTVTGNTLHDGISKTEKFIIRLPA